MEQVQLDTVHLLKNIGSDIGVSDISKWGDSKWLLNNTTPGFNRSNTVIHWDFSLSDGTSFSDGQYASLADVMRRFIWSLAVDNRHERNLKSLTLVAFGKGLIYLVRWMIDHGLQNVDELTPEACQVYLSDVTQDPMLDPDLERKCFIIIYNRLAVLAYLFRQRSVFTELGLPAVPQAPFGNLSITELTNICVQRAGGSLLPIPVSVALPILSAAHRFLDGPADDVIQLHNEYLDLRGWNETIRSDHKGMVIHLKEFEFRTLPGEQKPWHEKLSSISLTPEADQSEERNQEYPAKRLNSLLRDVLGATTTIILAGTGMRSSEICGLQGGMNVATGLPSCVEIRRSNTGINEIFYLKGKIFKDTDQGEAAEWVCGMRVLGTSEIPTVVRAVMVLERLLAPYREHSPHTELLTMSASSRGPAKRVTSISPPKLNIVLNAQRGFIERYSGIDWKGLPYGTEYEAFQQKGALGIKQRQWRKTWAHFMFSVDQSSLGAIGQQFKHLLLAVTEQAYLGSDPELLLAAHEVQLTNTVNTMLDLAHGKREIVGGLAKIFKEHSGELAELVNDQSKEIQRSNVKQFVLEHDFRLFFQDHGKCGIALRPREARCHQVAGTNSTINPQPNWATRETQLCASCPCWLTDEQHAGFWIERYHQTKRATLEHRQKAPDGVFRLFEARASQAAGILRALKIPIPDDDEVMPEYVR